MFDPHWCRMVSVGFEIRPPWLRRFATPQASRVVSDARTNLVRVTAAPIKGADYALPVQAEEARPGSNAQTQIDRNAIDDVVQLGRAES